MHQISKNIFGERVYGYKIVRNCISKLRKNDNYNRLLRGRKLYCHRDGAPRSSDRGPQWCLRLRVNGEFLDRDVEVFWTKTDQDKIASQCDHAVEKIVL